MRIRGRAAAWVLWALGAVLAPGVARADDAPAPEGVIPAVDVILWRLEQTENMAEAMRAGGREAEALGLVRGTLAIRQSLQGENSLAVASSLRLLARTLRDLKMYGEAWAAFDLSGAIRTRLLGPRHPDVAEVLNDHAVLLARLAAYPQARAMFEKAVSIWERHPDTASASLRTGVRNVARLAQWQGDAGGAAVWYQRLLPLQEALGASGDADVLETLTTLGNLEDGLRRYSEARAYLERALALYEHRPKPDEAELASRCIRLGTLLLDRMRAFGEAEPLLKRGLALRERVLPPEHTDIAVVLTILGQLYFRSGDRPQAMEMYDRALAIRERAQGPEHLDVAAVLVDMAQLRAAETSYDEAFALYDRCRAIREKSYGPDHPEVASVLERLGDVLAGAGKPDEARARFARAADIREIKTPHDDLGNASRQNRLGVLLLGGHLYKEAEPLFRQALEARQRLLPPEHEDIASALWNLGHTLYRLGDHVQTMAVYGRLLALREKAPGPGQSGLEAILSEMAGVLSVGERDAELRPIYERILHLREQRDGPTAGSVAASCRSLGGVANRLSDFPAARAFYQRALSINRALKGPQSPEVAVDLVRLGHVVEKQGQPGAPAEARRLYEEALAIDQAVYGPAHVEVATDLRNIADTLASEARLADARTMYQRALDMVDGLPGASPTEVADACSDLADLLIGLGEYKEARRLIERTIELTQRQLGPMSAELAGPLRTLQQLCVVDGDPAHARAAIDRALKIDETHFGAIHGNVADDLTFLARLEFGLGHADEARKAGERALAIRLQVSGESDRDTGLVQLFLSTIEAESGNLVRARSLLAQAVPVLEGAYGEESPAFAAVLNVLGYVLITSGAFDEASPVLERALGIMERTLPPDHPDLGDTLGRLGMLRAAQGLFEQALPLAQHALALHERQVGLKGTECALDLLVQVVALRRTGRGGEIRALVDRAAGLAEKGLTKNPAIQAVLLQMLASVLHLEDDEVPARELCAKAIGLYVEMFGEQHLLLAPLYQLMGEILRDMGDLDGAAAYLGRALRILEAFSAEPHRMVPAVQLSLADIRRRQHQSGTAMELLTRALATSGSYLRRDFVLLQGPERLATLREQRDLLEGWIGAAQEAGVDGYDQVLRFKGMALRATEAERRLMRRGGGAVPARVEALRLAEAALAALGNEAPPAEAEAHAAWRQAYGRAAAERERLAAALAHDFAPLRQGLERLDLGPKEVERELALDEAAVDVLRSNDHYYAWVLRRGAKIGFFDLGEAERIEQAVTAFLADVTAEATRRRGLPLADSAPAPHDWRQTGTVLRRLVLDPLRPAFGEGIRTVLLCPDASLAIVPFAILPDGTEHGVLGDQLTFVSVAMLQHLVPWKGGAAPAARRILLVGDVDYGAVPTAVAPLQAEGAGTALLAAAGSRAPRGDAFDALPGTRQEITALQAGVGDLADLVVGAAATEAAVHSRSKGCAVLHFATHGFVRQDLLRLQAQQQGEHAWLPGGLDRFLSAGYDPMVLSGLALAGANPRQGGGRDDGILTAAEASYLDLDGVNLVVLSACETAGGTPESGEGVLGLVQAFQMAGAKQVLGSLWRVDDEATALLMQRFYELHVPAGPGAPRETAASALHKAQEFVRTYVRAGPDGQPSTPYAAPVYWGAWVLWGVAR